MSRGKTENLFFTSEFAVLRDRWRRTKDDETLAQIVEMAPPGGDAEVGKAIARKLRIKRPDSKAHNDVLWREIDRIYRWLTIESGKTRLQAYGEIKKIYFPEKVSYSPIFGQISGVFKLLPAPADRFQCC